MFRTGGSSFILLPRGLEVGASQSVVKYEQQCSVPIAPCSLARLAH